MLIGRHNLAYRDSTFGTVGHVPSAHDISGSEGHEVLRSLSWLWAGSQSAFLPEATTIHTPAHTHTPVLHQNEALQGSVAIDSAFSFLQMCTLMWRSWCGLHPPLIPGEQKGYVPLPCSFPGWEIS